MSDDKLADQLQRLCCAETEGKFFDCVTDNIEKIIAALRRPAAAADEIERLREENRKLRAALSQQYATTASLLRSDQMPPEG